MLPVTSNQIAAFRSDLLATADAKTIRAFLLSVAATLQSADRAKIQSGFLREVSDLVLSLQHKMFASSNRYPRDVQMLYGDIRGLTMELEQREEEGKFDRQFFSGVYELGVRLADLATVVKVLAPLLMAWQGTSLN